MSRQSPIRDADGELLSAWLDGDLDDVAAAKLERRLRLDTDLAAAADAQRDLLVVLRRLDEVQPPDGYRDRLMARVAAEGAVTRHQRPRRSAPRSQVLTAAAAGLVLVAALGGAARWLTSPVATPDAQVATGAAELEAFAGSGEEARAGDIVVDDSATLPSSAQDPAALRELALQLQDSEQVATLLGRPAADAPTLAEEATSAVATALPGEPCLQQLLTTANGAVPARVDTINVDGMDALAAALVEASPGSPILDTVRVVVVNRADCSVMFSESGPGGR